MGPKLGAAEKTRACKEAFMWRIAFAQHRGLLPSPRPSPPSPTPLSGSSPFPLPKTTPTTKLAEGKVLEDGRFSWGGMVDDPVPKLVALLGGEATLTPRERRWLGLPRRDPENEWGGEEGMKVSQVSRPVLKKQSPPDNEKAEEVRFVSRVDRLDRVPNFGRYRSLERPFKGRIAERTLADRRQKIADKMAEMGSKVQEYQRVRPLIPVLSRLGLIRRRGQARREGRAKKRKELPF